ncbi:MAG: aldehyde dehydrogenase family protein, partial [Burkholderiaceae bacterium]
MPPAAEGALIVRSPIDGGELGRIDPADAHAARLAIDAAVAAQAGWQALPAPRRGELVRRFGERLRAVKPALGRLVTLETGKLLQEGLGEVQEMIDVCDFAVGLSRQLHGLVIASERPSHKMLESWHPFGTCAIISAFNFPVAVWSWNAALALVCGNTIVWKPSEKTPLTAWTVHQLLRQVLAEAEPGQQDIAQLLIGGRELGRQLVEHPGVRLVSATGSTAMGRAVGQACSQHFKRSILELGGNNAAIVTASADLALALRAVVFAAVGTAGQRCTTLRRLFVHRTRYADFVARLKKVYRDLPVGDPLASGTLVGPLIDLAAYERMQAVLATLPAGAVTGGHRELAGRFANAWYARPALVEMHAQQGPMLEETFAPILYVMAYDDLDEALRLNNASAHGLSSCIFTTDLRESERFLAGSDCGIANVNIGTSGAEIGG